LGAARWLDRLAARAGAAVGLAQPEAGSAALVAMLEDLSVPGLSALDLLSADLLLVDFWRALFPPAALAPVVLRRLCRRNSC
jgi:hypothetical protein